MKTVAVCAALVLAGCASPPRVWVKNGATQQDYYQQQGVCQAQAASVVGPLMQQAMVFNGCMRGLGWVLVERR